MNCCLLSWERHGYCTCNLPVRKTAIKRFSKINFTPLCCNATEWCPFSSIQPFGHIDFDIRSLYLMQVTDLGRLIFDQFDQWFVKSSLIISYIFFYLILSFSSLRTIDYRATFIFECGKCWCQSVIFHNFSVKYRYISIKVPCII